MNLRRLIQAAGMALILALAPALHAKDSGDCDVAIDLGKKPEMGDHSQLNAFIAAALEYKSQKNKQDQQRKACPELYDRPPTLWTDDPTVTQGPETLDSAVERSESFPSVDYGTIEEWHGRTTSKSFSLADVDSDQLADSLIRTSLLTIDSSGTQEGANQALSDAGQQAVILLAMNNFATEDGSMAQGMSEEQLTQTLLLAEQNTADAFAAETDELVSLLISPGGISLFFGPGGENLLISSQYEMESCLSSCGQFPITIGVQ